MLRCARCLVCPGVLADPKVWLSLIHSGWASHRSTRPLLKEAGATRVGEDPAAPGCERGTVARAAPFRSGI